jgi:beta-lactam-binding protein with PASTA domain
VPRGGAEVQRGTRITLFVSSGPEEVTVPGVIGLSRDSAEARLGDEGLSVSVEEVESDEPEGEVIAQSPSGGTVVDRGSAVTIEVSVGRPQITVPDVTGLSPAQASARLRAVGLVPSRQERPVTNQDEDGQVLEQRPGPGAEVEEGRIVVIVVGVLEEQEPSQPEPPAAPEGTP